MLNDKRGWPIFALMALITLLAVTGGIIVVFDKPEVSPDMANLNKRTINMPDTDDGMRMIDAAANPGIIGPSSDSSLTSGIASVSRKTEISLPAGYRDTKGILHRKAYMRPATDADIEYALEDPRTKENPAYAGILLLGRVVSIDGKELGSAAIEGLNAEDFYFLMSLFREINGKAVPGTGYGEYVPSENPGSVADEFSFTLPHGYLDEDGDLHRSGYMRRATAADEVMAWQHPMAKNNPVYGTVILLSNVITRLGDLDRITPLVIDSLSASDFAYLCDLYTLINGSGASVINPFALEYEFILPNGYLSEDGNLLRRGSMRIATEADEAAAMNDPRVHQSLPYFDIILLSRVITRLEDLPHVTPEVIENLRAEDMHYLLDFYNMINGTNPAVSLSPPQPGLKQEQVPRFDGQNKVPFK